MRTGVKPVPLLAAVLALGGALVGCGGDRIGVASVSGTVTWRGEPLPQGTIVFSSLNGRPGFGTIVDGRIVEVTTWARGDGAPVGPNKIAIRAVESGGGNLRLLIPARYGDPESSGLLAEVRPGAENVFEIILEDE